jgi:hypothetical protein
MEKIVLNVHSFNDLITNSSSEIFINSNKKTIEAVKTLINYFLEKGGSTKKAEDLFVFKIVRDSEQDHLTLHSESCLEIITKGNAEEVVNLNNEIRNAFDIEEVGN